MRTYIRVPIKILTPKIAQNKQNSIFYAGKNIAEVKILNRTYVLTTAGQYSFALKEGHGTVSFESEDLLQNWLKGKLPGRRPPRIFTDATIKTLGDHDLVSNWGWFGINVWVDKDILSGPVEVYSNYDEALESFIAYVEKDLIT
jgi:hypothetical protein